MTKPAGQVQLIVRKQFRTLAKWINAASGGRVSPNQITALSLLLYAPVGWLIIDGNLVLAGVLHIIFASMDLLDGELARLTGKASVFGMIFDASTDRLKIGITLAAIAQYQYLNQHEGVMLTALAIAVATTVSYVKAKGEVGLAIQNQKLTHHQVNRYFSEAPLSYDVLNIMIGLGLIFGLLEHVSAAIVALGIISIVRIAHKITDTLE